MKYKKKTKETKERMNERRSEPTEGQKGKDK